MQVLLPKEANKMLMRIPSVRLRSAFFSSAISAGACWLGRTFTQTGPSALQGFGFAIIAEAIAGLVSKTGIGYLFVDNDCGQNCDIYLANQTTARGIHLIIGALGSYGVFKAAAVAGLITSPLSLSSVALCTAAILAFNVAPRYFAISGLLGMPALSMVMYVENFT